MKTIQLKEIEKFQDIFHKLDLPKYKEKPFVMLNTDNVVLFAGSAQELFEMRTSKYYANCQVKAREHDLYLNNNELIGDVGVPYKKGMIIRKGDLINFYGMEYIAIEDIDSDRWNIETVVASGIPKDTIKLYLMVFDNDLDNDGIRIRHFNNKS